MKQKSANNKSFNEFMKKTGIFWVLVALIVIMSFANSAFLTPRNLLNVTKQASITTIIGVGMTFVLITGGIDLSVGSVMALSGTLAAATAVADKGIPLVVTILVGIAIGSFCGLLNGLGVAYVGFPPFIMTLGMMTIARGIAMVYTNGTPIFGLSSSFNSMTSSTLLGIPSLVYYMLVVFIIGYIILNKTVFGRRIYATGGNVEAARLSGIAVSRLIVLVYTISGFLSGLAGILICSRITSGNATVASGYEMNAISSAVIGGVSMSGGSGSVVGTIIGALILTIIQNSFDIMGINSFYQDVIKGIIILLAVFLDIRGKKKV